MTLRSETSSLSILRKQRRVNLFAVGITKPECLLHFLQVLIQKQLNTNYVFSNTENWSLKRSSVSEAFNLPVTCCPNCQI